MLEAQQQVQSCDPTVAKWQAALGKLFEGQVEAAIAEFEEIHAHSAKVHFNVALLHRRAGRLHEALRHIDRCIAADPYMAVALFVRATLLHLSSRLHEAVVGYTDALGFLQKDSKQIDYQQLKLQFVLKRDEILFNRALALAQLGLLHRARDDLLQCSRLTGEGGRQAAELLHLVDAELLVAQPSALFLPHPR